VSLLNEQAQIAERIKANFPDLSQVDGFLNAVRSIPRLQFNAAQLKALDEALQPAKRLKTLIETQGGTAALAKRIEKATSALQRFRNIQVHHAVDRNRTPASAYRLEEDDA
jgi:hypothetical protein